MPFLQVRHYTGVRNKMPKGVYIRTEYSKNAKGKHWKIKDTSRRNIDKIGKKRPPFSQNWKDKISKSNLADKSCHWKGINVGYKGIHEWVKKWKGRPDTCEHCGKTQLKGRQIHWANVDHQYRRVLEDFIRLCKDCHKKYDRNIKTYYKYEQQLSS